MLLHHSFMRCSDKVCLETLLARGHWHPGMTTKKYKCVGIVTIKSSDTFTGDLTREDADQPSLAPPTTIQNIEYRQRPTCSWRTHMRFSASALSFQQWMPFTVSLNPLKFTLAVRGCSFLLSCFSLHDRNTTSNTTAVGFLPFYSLYESRLFAKWADCCIIKDTHFNLSQKQVCMEHSILCCTDVQLSHLNC